MGAYQPSEEAADYIRARKKDNAPKNEHRILEYTVEVLFKNLRTQHKATLALHQLTRTLVGGIYSQLLCPSKSAQRLFANTLPSQTPSVGGLSLSLAAHHW